MSRGVAAFIVRLYPRAWRERYGDEFEEVIHARPLTMWAVIDILSGAIDARLSSNARMSRLGKAPAGEGAVMIDALKRSCARTSMPLSLRDGIVGAIIMVGSALVFAALTIWLHRSGHAYLSSYVSATSLFASMTLALPVTFLKGQPWRAQVVIVGGTMAILILIGLA